MQNIIIDKPYSFVPPHTGAFWPAVFHPFLRPYIAKAWGVTTVEFKGVERLQALVKERASIVLAPNHCRGSDPTVVALLGAQAGALHLHHGELAPVHGRPLSGLVFEADRRVQRLQGRDGSRRGQVRDRAPGRGSATARDFSGRAHHAGQRQSGRVQ